MSMYIEQEPLGEKYMKRHLCVMCAVYRAPHIILRDWIKLPRTLVGQS